MTYYGKQHNKLPVFSNALVYKSVFILVLFFVARSDFKYYIVSNYYILILFLVQLLYLESFYQFVPAFFASFFLLLLNFILSRRKKKEHMGMADVKLIFVLALSLNAFELTLFLWLSSLLALIVHKLFFSRNEQVPFATYLSLCYIIFLFNFHDSLLTALL